MADKGFSRLFSLPAVRAEGEEEEEEELIDPQTSLREKCGQHKHVMRLFDKLQDCNDRVNSRTETAETCVQEMHDYIHELDHCVSHSLFKMLK